MNIILIDVKHIIPTIDFNLLYIKNDFVYLTKIYKLIC